MTHHATYSHIFQASADQLILVGLQFEIGVMCLADGFLFIAHHEGTLPRAEFAYTFVRLR